MNKKDWEKEFDKPSFWADLKPIQKKGIKRYINSLLAKQKKEIIEKLEKMKKPEDFSIPHNKRNDTLDQAIKSIKEKGSDKDGSK